MRPICSCGFFLLMWCLWPVWAGAQSHAISGYVEDAPSGERLPNVSVGIPALGTGTTTNAYGFYSLATYADSVEVLVSHIGYTTAIFQFVLSADTTLNVALEPLVIGLEEIEVVAEAESAVDQVQMSRQEISVEKIRTLPALLGEVDIQKALQLLPGVQSGTEGKSGFYVRGGGPDQNLILLDGLPLYNPTHLFGFLSAFNADAMKQVELFKGGFPARYGGRLSSVVNLTMKEGNMKKFAGEGGIGIISTRAMLEGPVVKDRASFLFSVRRTLLDLFLLPFQPRKNHDTYFFHDLNAKVNYIASRRDRIYLSAWSGRDFLRITDPYDRGVSTSTLGWGGRLVALRWNRMPGPRTFSNMLIGMTTWRMATGGREERKALMETYEANYETGIVDLTAKIDIEHRAMSRHYVRFGGEGILHRFIPGRFEQYAMEDGETLVDTTVTSPVGVVHARQFTIYAEDEMALTGALRLNIGLRFASYLVERVWYRSLEPRVSVSQRLTPRMVVKFSYAVMQQPVHLLTSSGGNLLTDLWIPSIGGIAPQRGHQVAVGIVRGVSGGAYEGSIEAYYKSMAGLIEYRDGAGHIYSALRKWPELVETGKGFSYGVEVFLQKKTGRLTGWTGYTWAYTTRDFEGLNGGRPFSDRYDRRHDVSVVLQHRLKDTWDLSLTWVYGSGYPVWLPVGRYRVIQHDHIKDFPEYVDYGPRNASRMPDYHRIDMAMYLRKEKSWGERTITIGVYNAYSRQNPFFIYPEIGGRSVVIRKFTLFPVLPFLAYQVRL